MEVGTLDTIIRKYLMLAKCRAGIPKILVMNVIDRSLQSRISGMGIEPFIFDDIIDGDTRDLTLTDKIGDYMFSLFGKIFLHSNQVILISRKYLIDKTYILFLRYGCAVHDLYNDGDMILDLISRSAITIPFIPFALGLISPPESVTANCLRSSLSSLLVGKKYLLGVEHETMTSTSGEFEYVGRNEYPFGYSNHLFGKLVEYKKPEIVVNGQQKLYAVDSPFVSGECLVIGGSPGYHFLDYHQVGHITIVDPLCPCAAILADTRFSYINGKFSPDIIDFIPESVIIDIREDVGSAKHGDWDENFWDLMIDRENILITAIFIYFQELGTSKISVKFHPGYSIPPLVPGEIVFCPFQHSTSKESRIYFPGRMNSMLEFCEHTYIERLRKWQIYSNQDILNQDIQSKLLACYFTIRGDFMRMDLPARSSFLAMYSVSNTLNDRNAPFELLSKTRGICVLPSSLGYIRGDSLDVARVQYKSYLTNGKTLDYLYSPYEFLSKGCFVYNPLDIIVYCGYKAYHGWYNPNSEQLNSWFVVSNYKLIPDDEIDHVFNTQTFNVRLLTPFIRYWMGYDRYTLHEYRNILVDFLRPTYTPDATGLFRGGVIQTGGHLLNMILASAYVNIDFKRYLKVVVHNINRESNDPYGKLDLLAEMPSHQRHRWHTKFELLLALKVAIQFIKMWRLPVKCEVLHYVFSVLRTLG